MKIQGVEYGHVKYKGKRIQTYTFGHGTNVVLCLPPYPHSGIIYLNLAKYNLHRNLKFVSFDIPGWVGNSENIFVEKDFDILDIVEICDAIVDQFELEKFSILGFSFGTSIEALYAATSVDKIKSLVFISPLINSRVDAKDRNSKIVRTIFPFKPGNLLKGYVMSRYKYLYSKVMLQNGMPLEMIKEYGRFIQNASPKVLLQSLFYLFQNTYGKLVYKFKDKPILIINSRNETPMFRKNAAFLRANVIGEESLFIHGAHEDFLLKPNPKVYEQIFTFLASKKHKIVNYEKQLP